VIERFSAGPENLQELESVSELITSLEPVTLTRGHHSIQSFNEIGLCFQRLPHSIIQRIQQSGFVERVSTILEKEGFGILNNVPLELLTEKQIQKSERLAIATSTQTMFNNVFRTEEDAEIVLAIRSHIKEAIVKLQVLDAIQTASSTDTGTSSRRHIGTQKGRITLMESILYSMPGSEKIQLVHRDMLPVWNGRMVLCFVGLQDDTLVSLVPRSHLPDFDTDSSMGAKVFRYNQGDILFFKPALLHSGYKYPGDGNVRMHYYALPSLELRNWKGEKAHFADQPDIHAIEHFHFGGKTQEMVSRAEHARRTRVQKKRKVSELAAEARDAKAIHRAVAISCDETMKRISDAQCNNESS
jgi:hypothetical protein